MLFVPFTVPTFPATHHQTTHPAHQTHHQQLQATTQNPVQQPQQLTQLNQLSHLNHQGIVPATTNQPTIHSTSCSPQQQATTPNKVKTKTKTKKKKNKKNNVTSHFFHALLHWTHRFHSSQWRGKKDVETTVLFALSWGYRINERVREICRSLVISATIERCTLKIFILKVSYVTRISYTLVNLSINSYAELTGSIFCCRWYYGTACS